MDFFSKCEQIRNFLRIWSHLLKKPLMENVSFCAVTCGLGLYGGKNYAFHDRGRIFLGESVTVEFIEIGYSLSSIETGYMRDFCHSLPSCGSLFISATWI